MLALAPTYDEGRVVRLPLPKGETGDALDDSQPWGAVLALIRAAASGPAPLSLPDVGGGVFRGGSLVGAVDAALRKLEGGVA